uniref:Solute carrier family 25 member 15b n=1 Tax=Cyprinus carpio TaxID=7962 RepID=A0A8C1QYS2_CYPCA
MAPHPVVQEMIDLSAEAIGNFTQHQGHSGGQSGTLSFILAGGFIQSDLHCIKGIKLFLISSLIYLVFFLEFKCDAEEVNDMQKACAGSVASVFFSLVLCPTELVKCQLQAMHEMATSGKISIMHYDGPLPGYFCFFGAYELCRSLFAEYMHCGKDDIGMQTVTVSTLKSRIQVMSMTGKQSGFFKTFMHIFRTEGICERSVLLSNGALFLGYEASRNIMMAQFDS